MKVLNLTDVETPTLKQRGYVGQTIAVGDVLVPPGQSADISDEAFKKAQPQLQTFLDVGALALKEAPASYSAARSAKKPPEEKPAAPAPPAAESTPATTRESRRGR